jgi:hypothetical protein
MRRGSKRATKRSPNSCNPRTERPDQTCQHSSVICSLAQIICLGKILPRSDAEELLLDGCDWITFICTVIVPVPQGSTTMQRMSFAFPSRAQSLTLRIRDSRGRMLCACVWVGFRFSFVFAICLATCASLLSQGFQSFSRRILCQDDPSQIGATSRIFILPRNFVVFKNLNISIGQNLLTQLSVRGLVNYDSINV